MGINIEKTTLRDFQGRPQFLVEHNQYQPMPELV